MEDVELLEQDVVVVVAASVAGDRSGGRASPVIHCDDDRALRAWNRPTRVGTLLRGALQVRHVASVSPLEPLVERARRLHGAQARDTSKVEPESVRLRLDQ